MLSPVTSTDLLQTLQRECLLAQALLQRFSLQPQPTPPTQLERTDYDVAVRGTYSAIKQVVKAVSDRYGQVTIQSLRLQRMTAPAPGATAELEAQVRLTAWAKPLPMPTKPSIGAN